MVWGRAEAPIMLIGQAPSRTVHQTRRPFNDASGKKLRRWLGVNEDTFWNQSLFYIGAVGRCYPGSTGKKGGGDRPPSPICAPLYLDKEVVLLQPELYLMVGGHSARHFFGNKRLNELVFEDLRYKGMPAFVLPHPSPLNMKWFKDHPHFEEVVLPSLQAAVQAALSKSVRSLA
ncbi:uracil-DNA glycosylase, family 4 [Cesiribacter andamanensis AMV16]|uniref:Uracil-DNA glycosylase, family 4 n=2 Tax=Cesiribacter TaxID=1133570 RepID=M7NK81_9BACT|nr:uracil-DNA glycosylase, family 4 [Cesiribacter andamanensis AMV16]